MPWQNQGGGPWGGGGGGGGGPWGGGPWGGGRGPTGPGQPPNLEDLLRRAQENVRRYLPGGFGGSGLAVILGILFLVWLASGFFTVAGEEQGVVLRFGQPVRTTAIGAGWSWHLPYPIETVEKPKVTRVNRVELGMRTAFDLGGRADAGRQIPEEALMLTGDENIVDINFVVFWQVKNATDYLFNVRTPETTIKAAAESTMREIIGQTPIALALAEGRATIEQRVRERLQTILDDYGTGVSINQVQLLKVDPPAEVIDAFRDVQRARADQERERNQAEAYRNDIIPRARGDAERLIQEAEAYRQEIVARAQGDAQRFVNVYEAYKANRDVTTQRLYLETLEEVLRNANKVIIDQERAGSSGVVPYLPLPEVQRRNQAAPASAPRPQQPAGGQVR